MSQTSYPQPEGHPMRRFALFVVVLTAVVAVGSQPWSGNRRSGQTACSRLRTFMGSFRAHAKADGAPAYGAALGTADGWNVHDCSGEDHNRTNWGWGHQERACEMRTMVISAPGKLDVSSMNGGIDVVGEDRKDVRVDARVEAWADSSKEASDILREVEIQASGGTIRDKGPNFHWGNRGYSVSYTIHAPHQLSAELKTMNGGIGLSHLDGDLNFDTTNGGVDLTDLAGKVHGSTVNGGLDIALSGDRWHGEGLHAETTNGGISLNLPEKYAAHLETGTVNGGIELNFPITIQGEIKHHLETDLGGGGPTIHAETTNGGVTVSHSSKSDQDSM
ncbi:hypothetical protein HNQ77_003711 [Silvibacterium bohemicum]|uniref:DUF4097 domain-containing protein n=1 Tax=Silvibacterium bohemicum TaxID=1577686 RepID=A0A841JX76_9BACT|nr:DUF4097 family beta strand repeat-containing protein [Silvibacterium bohemicum]MBB6145750.1 hypothetical protein [Silvibacterium bohemicum]